MYYHEYGYKLVNKLAHHLKKEEEKTYRKN